MGHPPTRFAGKLRPRGAHYDRQPQSEHTALAWGAFHVDLTAVALCDRLTQEKAEASARSGHILLGLLKERVSDLDALVRTLRKVVGGGSVIDPKVVEVLLGRRARQEESRLATLSPRELEVLAKMAEGRTNPVIARSLFMSESTVEKHVSAIFSKLGLSEEKEIDRRVAAVLAYLREADSLT